MNLKNSYFHNYLVGPPGLEPGTNTLFMKSWVKKQLNTLSVAVSGLLAVPYGKQLGIVVLGLCGITSVQTRDFGDKTMFCSE